MTTRKEAGADVKGDDIKKHRNDVFRLALTLPGEPGDSLPEELASDVNAFLAKHPPEFGDWKAIQQAVR